MSYIKKIAVIMVIMAALCFTTCDSLEGDYLSLRAELTLEMANVVGDKVVDGFKMGKYPVTQSAYNMIMGDDKKTSLVDKDEAKEGAFPMIKVSWYDALVFCNKLSMKEGLKPAYQINNSTDPVDWKDVPIIKKSVTWDNVIIVKGSDGYRLPTAEQWEYAAKGGNVDKGKFIYSGNDKPTKVAWYSKNSEGHLHQVSEKNPNGLDIYDMSGNIWEWCWDWDGTTSSAKRVIRGGAYDSTAKDIRLVAEDSRFPFYRGHNVGFRLVRP